MRSLFPIVLIFFCRVSIAQQNSIWFEEVIDEEGYPIIGVNHILQDREGFVWLCHTDGISKFDGYSFKQYSRKELMTPYFKSKMASLVFEDKKQNLWIVTDVGALMQYQPDLDRFVLKNDTSSVIEGAAYDFVEDDQGNFWIGSASGGLYKINLEKKIFKNYRVAKNDTTTINNDYVIALALDNNQNLWIGTTNGLCRYDYDRDAFRRVKLTNSNPEDVYRFRVIRSLLFSKDERLYVGTYGGLHCIDLKKNVFKHYIHDPANNQSLSHNSIFKLQEDKQGNIWIATYGGGINQYNPAEEKFSSWLGTATDRGRLGTNNLFTLYFDCEGKLWVGGADDGVFLYDPSAKKIHSIGYSPYDTSGISPGWIRHIYQENDSIIWIGFNGAGINRYNIKSGKVLARFINDPRDTSSLGHNVVLAIDQDSKGNLWFGLGGGGVNRLDKTSGTFTRYSYKPAKNSISNNAVSALLIDDDVMWITSYVSGLDVLNMKSNMFYHFSEDSLKSLGISFSKTQKILKHNGNIWFATHEGAVVFDKAQRVFVKIPNSKGEMNTVSNDFGFELRPYNKEEILINNNPSEIWKISYTNPTDFRREILWKDTFNILRDEEFRFIADQSGKLWISNGSNLTHIDLKKGDNSTFGVTNSLMNERRMSGIFTADDGRIFLTGANGFIWFYPNEIKKDSTPLKVVLTGLDIFNEPVPVVGEDALKEQKFHLPKQIGNLETLELDHHQNFFSFRFAALAFTHRDKIQYAYQLEGFDRDWVYAGNRKYASYTNLDPGKYIFKVKATNTDGCWNEEPITIDVVILPPFWKTPWFIALTVLLSAAIIYIVHRYRVAQSLKVERLRNKIASDLHDEVGSSLTRISIYSDLLQKGMEEQDRKTYLSGIGELSREVVSTMSDIVWSIENRNDTFGALIIHMKDFATEVLQVKNIDLEFSIRDIDENKTLDPALKQNIYLIFKESIHNIVKHAHAHRVCVSLVNEKGEFNMVIKDDGCGFIRNGSDKGNGLRNMQRRAASVGGEFQIQNQEGTTLTLKCKAI